MGKLMNPYPSYKPTNIEWIGNIPEHWSCKRLKRFAKICNGQDAKEVLDENGEFPIIGTGGEFGRANKFLHLGKSVILGRKGTIDKPQYLETPFWSVDTAYYTEIFDSTFPKFFYYLCTTIQFDFYRYGSAVPSMTQEALNHILFPSPLLSEQIAIANYLDHKTALINMLIADKQKLIELFKEERTAIINEAVSGEGKGWKRTKLKYVLSNHDYVRVPLSAEQRGDMEKTYDYYGASGIIDKVDNFLFDGEYILIGEDGANLLTRNSALAFKAKGKFWVNNHAHILKPKNGNIDFFVHLLESIDYTIWITGSAQPKLTAENLFNIELIIPSEDEQNQIVLHIHKEIQRINNTISDIETEIKLLKEYRTALISEVVTGKISVSDFTPSK
ncbi:MAG: restriction endonuclease subunit S [Bacteroidota bacterium]